MFERYSERGRRVLFFARYEVSEVGGISICQEHLLLALMRESKGLCTQMFSSAGVPLDNVRLEIEKQFVGAEKISTSVEMPFAESTRRLLRYAAEEADRLSHRNIGPPHLLLGLLRVDGEPIVVYLADHGLRLSACRDQVAKEWRDEDQPTQA